MITSQFTNGLGNRLFTLNKLLSEARKNNLEPVFVAEVCQPNKHCPVNNLFPLFPHIRIVKYDKHDKSVKVLMPPVLTLIDSSFIKEKHLISESIQLPIEPLIKDTFFVHFRRGDYDNNVNYTDLSKTSYYKESLKHFSDRGHTKALIFSNDISWCRLNTTEFFEGFDIDYDTSENEIMSLAKMKACALGGISANSTFGFWALQLNEGPHKIIPSPFPMKNIWPISTEISKDLTFNIVRLKGQNNYSLIIAIVLLILISYSFFAAVLK